MVELHPDTRGVPRPKQGHAPGQGAAQLKSCGATSLSKTVPGIQIPGNSNFHCGESGSDAASNGIRENLLGMTGGGYSSPPCLSFLL